MLYAFSTLYALDLVYVLSILDYKFYTLYSVLYTPYCILYTLYSLLYTPHFTSNALCYALYILYATLCTISSFPLQFMLHALNYILYTIHYILYNLHSVLHTLYSTLCALYLIYVLSAL